MGNPSGVLWIRRPADEGALWHMPTVSEFQADVVVSACGIEFAPTDEVERTSEPEAGLRCARCIAVVDASPEPFGP